MMFGHIHLIGLKLLTAGLWVCLLWFATQLFGLSSAGLFLYALAASGAVAVLLSCGWPQLIVKRGAQCDVRLRLLMSAGIRSLMVRFLTVLFVLCLAMVFFTPVVGGLEGADLIWTVIAAGTHGLVLLLSAAFKARQRGALSLVLSGPVVLTGVFAGLCVTQVSTDPQIWHVFATASALHICCFSVCVGRTEFVRPMFRKPVRGTHSFTFAQIGALLIQNLDLLVVGVLVPPIDLAIYLVCRRLAGMLQLVFDALRTGFMARTALVFASNNKSGFLAFTNKMNRSFLIAGSVSLAVLGTVAHRLAEMFDAPPALFVPVLLWHMGAQSAPAVFGATGMILTMTGHERVRAAVFALSLLPGTLLLVIGAQQGPVMLAATFAAVGLTVGAIQAVLAYRKLGVRPGLFVFSASAVVSSRVF